LRQEGRTTLITTQDMAEAEALRDRVALIDHGKVLAVETLLADAHRYAKPQRSLRRSRGDLRHSPRPCGCGRRALRATLGDLRRKRGD
jgi:ABC-type multidrug transport system ATPase subunit